MNPVASDVAKTLCPRPDREALTILNLKGQGSLG